MTMSKHTPAPWSYRKDRLTVDADGIAIADIRCSDVADEAIEPNARLIAAAPEMLAALKGALDWMQRYAPPESHFYEITQVKMAIAKAEGRT